MGLINFWGPLGWPLRRGALCAGICRINRSFQVDKAQRHSKDHDIMFLPQHKGVENEILKFSSLTKLETELQRFEAPV